MKLNCDLGENVHGNSLNNDAIIMPYIDLANIACGFHASDPKTMLHTIKLANQYSVTIGAHPSYPDRENFGRRSMQLSEEELIATLHYQIGALQGLCAGQSSNVSYVKPHGALYNDMMCSKAIFTAVCKALATMNSALPLMVQALPNMAVFDNIARQHHITLWYEAFADRAYTDGGTLVSRQQENAVITDHKQVLTRCKLLAQQQTLLSEHGHSLALQANTLCVHGDNPNAIELVKSLRAMFDEK